MKEVIKLLKNEVKIYKKELSPVCLDRFNYIVDAGCGYTIMSEKNILKTTNTTLPKMFLTEEVAHKVAKTFNMTTKLEVQAMPYVQWLNKRISECEELIKLLTV